MEEQGGTFIVQILINNAVKLSFVVDSGAEDVSIPEDVFKTLLRTKTISDVDILSPKFFQLADCSTSFEKTFRIRILRVGDRELENVTASVPPETASLLLGQSFLTRFKSWSIDNERHVLLLN
jgi:predicted aspartyl protease